MCFEAESPSRSKPLLMANSVTLTLTYDASRLAPPPHEFAPVLAVWSSFEGTKTIQFHPIRHVNRANISEPIAVELPLPTQGSERRDDAIWFEAYALDSNKTGEYVRNRVGSGFVYVSELISDAGPLTVDLAYFNYFEASGERRIKGRLGIAQYKVGATYRPAAPAKETPFDYVPAQNAFIQAEMEDAIRLSIWPYTDAASAQGEGIAPLDKKNTRVHAPTWNGPSGWLPGYMYFVTPGQRAPPSIERTEAYMANLFAAVLARNNVKERWFCKTVSRQMARTDDVYDDAFTQCCNIVGEALCAPSVSMPYIGDAVNTAARTKLSAQGTLKASEPSIHGVESFDWAQLRGGGDCEDFARLIHAHYGAIKDGKWKSPVVQAASLLLQCYVGVGILASVLGAQLGDEKHSDEPIVLGAPRDTNVQIGAHMYHQLVPEHKFIAMVKRVTRDIDVAALRNKRAPQASWREKMPHLVLEGTGMLRPLQRPIASYATTTETRATWVKAESNLAKVEGYFSKHVVGNFQGRSIPLLSLAQTPRRQREQHRVPNARINAFYRDSTHAYTDDFISRGFSVAEFSWVSLGQPQLVPATADANYADDPMLTARSASPLPAGDGADADTEAETGIPVPTLWERTENEFSSDSTIGDDVSESSDESEAQSFADRPLPAESHWRKPRVGAEVLLGAVEEQNKTGTKRFDRFDYSSDEHREVRYGIPLTSSLEDRPMLSHVGLLAGPPIDGVAAGVLATHYRHSKPVPLAGDLASAKAMHDAQLESLRANGVDIDQKLSMEAEQFRVFSVNFKERVSEKWQDKTKLTLVNLFISTKYFRTEGVGEFLLSALVPERKRGLIKYGRIRKESFIPGHTNMVIQLLCDPELAL